MRRPINISTHRMHTEVHTAHCTLQFSQNCELTNDKIIYIQPNYQINLLDISKSWVYVCLCLCLDLSIFVVLTIFNQFHNPNFHLQDNSTATNYYMALFGLIFCSFRLDSLRVEQSWIERSMKQHIWRLIEIYRRKERVCASAFGSKFYLLQSNCAEFHFRFSFLVFIQHSIMLHWFRCIFGAMSVDLRSNELI